MITDYEIITAPKIEDYLNCGRTSSYKYYNDIKKHFKINVVLGSHFKKYFKVPNSDDLSN